ncbi:MAG TPA: MFS transporter, partial [Jiangellaceae bacterium]|nr:MFS transporter [Jiangellaceae bacterium]
MSSYQRLVVSSGLSNLADGIFQVALPIVTLGVTRDPGAFAAVTLALRLPWLLFALPAGAYADRLDRRRTMLLISLGRAVVIGGLAAIVASGGETLWLLCAAAFVLGMGETLFDTSAQSIIPSVVPADDLSRANARLYAVELTANQFIGPPIGGLIAGIAAAAALGGSAGAYVLAAVVLALISGSFRPERTGPATRLRHDIAEGARYLNRHRLLRTLAILVGISNLTWTATLAILALYAIEPGPMGLPEAGYGALLAVGAAGALVGTFIVPSMERLLGRSRALLVSYVGFSALEGLPGLTASVPAVAASFFVAGAIGIAWNVITVSLRQRIVPDRLLGRVNAGYRLLAWGTMPLGAALGGLLGDLFGLRAVFLTAAAASLAGVPLFLAVVSDGAISAAERESE